MTRTWAYAGAFALCLALNGCGTAGGGTAAPAATTISPSTSVSPAPVPAGKILPPCPATTPVPPRSDGLPALTLECLGDGPSVRLSDLRGVPMVLTVWAAWCTNCDREMPLFSAAQVDAGSRLRFFGVHGWAERDYALRSAQDFGVTFPSAHEEDAEQIRLQLRAPAPPTTFFVTADGRVAHEEIGEITSQRELNDLIAKHLGVQL